MFLSESNADHLKTISEALVVPRLKPSSKQSLLYNEGVKQYNKDAKEKNALILAALKKKRTESFVTRCDPACVCDALACQIVFLNGP